MIKNLLNIYNLMDIIIDNSYEKEALLIRYAALLFNNKKVQNKYGEKLIKAANDLKFYAYPTTLMNNSSDPSISSAIKPHLTQNNSEKLVLEMNQIDSHFIDSIGVSDIDANVENIFNAYNNFFNCGNLDKLIRACYRFLKRIKGANEYDMNDIVVRYMVSCICMNDYSNSINIIENIGQNYILFDYNIYIFLLYFIQGKYEQACETILQIKNNISDNLNQLITEKDLAFYFSFCLLYNFKAENYKQVLSNNDSLVYKLYDKYNEYFKIIDEYFRCDYLKVNSDFNKIINEKIQKDPFLSGFSQIIEEKFKKKILKEILSFSSEISLDTIKDILLLNKKENALNMVVDLIKSEKINAVIDDIEGIVIMKEKNPINEILEKSNEIMKNNLKDLIKYSLNKNVKHKLLAQNFQKLDGIEMKPIGGGDAGHELGESFMMRMAMGMKMPGM
jgi:hypothetical protein